MSQNNQAPVLVGGVAVNPYESVEQLLADVISPDGKVIPGMAVAINPEKVLKALDDPETKEILAQATLPYADGIGVVKSLQQKTGKKCIRIAGCELWLDILNHSVAHQSKVVLIGAKPQVVERCNEILTSQNVNVVSYQNGYFESENVIFDLIKKTSPDIVIVALGSPKQEKLIAKMRLIHNKALYMGVGGSFDVLTGNVKRAPKAWQNLNLEWLYRLTKEPKRIFRQLKLLKFLHLYLLKKL
ncbi:MULTISPECIES: WecB/TagA/CpsF family glycosyltransferase [Pseudoalteromonas]|uniref:WecB/TagA/CpsF family glycosyltransferase n=1 Tax=Pseudoalteromonas TaxID=53246 RepID=UPI0015817603|nr:MULTISPECIES: WecB/TagA/CpsF family glycosyltransferase [Pseudoalteromonas]MDI4652071.1 WecB/TagA/CpsF family glycosyltransferase [Pseudoalteromonas shioyasakiensis]NUJ38396.1 WecB/TagA/CpsF family glycosyltransferase [Pseudoalteromonas sp. 0303]